MQGCAGLLAWPDMVTYLTTKVLLNSMMLAQVPVQRLGPNEAPILPAKFLTDGDQATNQPR